MDLKEAHFLIEYDQKCEQEAHLRYNRRMDELTSNQQSDIKDRVDWIMGRAA